MDDDTVTFNWYTMESGAKYWITQAREQTIFYDEWRQQWQTALTTKFSNTTNMDPPDWLEAFKDVKLSIELVPQTCWWSNVRSNVSKADWNKCKSFVAGRSGNKCEICGGRGKVWPIECHEIWYYNDETNTQMLVDLIALCPQCHQVKHYGRSALVGNEEAAFKRLMNVNGWNADTALTYLRYVDRIWKKRSTREWSLNVDFLGLIGVNVPERLDRQEDLQP